MSDQDSPPGDEVHQPKAIKDRPCIFCQKEFTSSSLGRHYDTFIKEKNPKPPDGVHDIERIKEMRQGITRRQPRTSMARRRTSTAANTPAIANTPAAASPALPDSEACRKREIPPGDSRFPITGVINGIPLGGNDLGEDVPDTPGLAPAPISIRNASRAVSKQLQKHQLEQRQKATEMSDQAKAAQLALHEFLLSYRASKLNIDLESNPFEFDPRQLDFCGLVLRCLEPPPTMFSANPHGSPTSWSLNPPGETQLHALRTFFQDEFRKWKLACKAATTAIHDDLSSLPTMTPNPPPRDRREMIIIAERKASEQERSILEHLEASYSTWTDVEPSRQREFWHLELARAYTTCKRENSKLREQQQKLNQEIATLQAQVGELSHCQYPREFKIQTPAIIPFQQNLVSKAAELALQGSLVGFQPVDRHSDVNSVVQSAIERWKKVIVSNRAAQGLAGQRPLDQPVTHLTAPAASTAPSETISHASSIPKSATASPQKSAHARPQALPNGTSKAGEPRHALAATPQQQAKPNLAANRKPMVAPQVAAPVLSKSSSYSRSQPSESSKSSVATTSMDVDDSSDQDADGDADMEDDDAYMDTSQASQQPHSPLEVARTRPLQPAPVQHQPQSQQPHLGGQSQQQQHQLHHHQAQRANQYMMPTGRVAVGNNPGSNGQSLNPGHVQGIPRQMLHSMPAGTPSHISLNITGQDDMFLN